MRREALRYTLKYDFIRIKVYCGQKKGTADDELWPMIKKKLDVLNKAGLSKDDFENSESKEVISKGQKRIEDFFG